MYYHVIIELGEEHHKDQWDKYEIKSDIIDLEEVINKFSEPYQLGCPILINGRTIPIEHIKRLRLFSSEISGEVLRDQEKARHEAKNRASRVAVIGFYTNYLQFAILKEKDITDELITYAKGTKKETPKELEDIGEVTPSKVFIVHGHDDGLLNEVKAFLSSQAIDPIILREQYDGSLTIIEKLERYTKDPSIGFGIVLYTPDDQGKAINEEGYKFRARQNVVFEHGLLIGLYGRERVVSLVKTEENIEMPSDVNGVVYTDHSHKDWRIAVAHMLNDAGYNINYRKIS
ncbi:nucleotide-binding protein [Acinetobacter junii]|uniref:TIR domain-containing protein n=1 Tax=Acinetobacter TaxID=469 RepID=UPI000DEEC4AF|nr:MULTISPECIES: nucleotide-binding protein [Acinetobacter]MDA3508744.1 nucleotide-binding protein [Acinetobacter junii]MDA3533186.1 nucleotide-binding protein [Acinetobacter junii]